MTRAELDQLQADLDLMRAAGCTTLPLRIEVIERMMAVLRRRARGKAGE